MAIKPNKQMLVRTIFVMVTVILCLTIISGASLINIMIIHGEEYQTKASEQQLYDSLITAPRGDIYDTNMNLLATSSTAWTVYITPNGFNNLKADEADKIRKLIARELSEILELEYDDVLEKTQKNSYYVIVKKKIEKTVADKVREFISSNSELSMTKYVGLDETTKRFYPNDSLASAVLGFVGDDNQGLAGLESYYDNELTGVAGRVIAAKNARGTDMPFTYEKVEEGKQGDSLVSTIDSYIQYVSEKYLDAAVEEEKAAERGAAIVMNVNTGAILGMAVSGDFNPNEPFKLSVADQKAVDEVEDEEEKSKLKSELLNRQWRNKAVSDTYEPGSVFKIFTAATALEENLISQKNSFSCNWTYTVASQRYHCHKTTGHGTQNLKQAISNSCNPAFIQIGQLIGVDIFSKYFKAFGLTGKTGIDLPGEADPYYHKKENMGVTELASSSFGQTFNITPIQMVTLAATAVNGGKLITPHLVERMIDSEGNVTKTVSTEIKRQVISKETSATMRELLEYVAENGAKNGLVAGYRVGGKTGTSQKVSKILETDNKSLYIGSYVGIAPIDNPEIAVFVMIDEPTSGRYYGSIISAPVGSRIMSDIMPYLGFEAQYSEDELKKLSVSVPDVVGKELDEAKSVINDNKLSYKIVGNGDKVTKQLPAAASNVHNGGTVILYTDNTTSEKTTVPNLVGLTANEVNNAAANAGINIEFSGAITSSTVKSYRQSIEAGSEVALGEIVTVYFRDEETVDLAQGD